MQLLSESPFPSLRSKQRRFFFEDEDFSESPIEDQDFQDVDSEKRFRRFDKSISKKE